MDSRDVLEQLRRFFGRVGADLVAALVLDRDRGFRIRFEVKRRNEYLDFLPVLQRYRRYPEASPE